MKTIKISPFVPTNIDVQQITPNRAKISAYPFETGYAITLAHPIRRLLMSSSIGYAVVGINIDGVTHEFDSIRGMTEDVSHFIVNLRQIRFVIKDPEQMSVVVNYSFTGGKVLLGADLSTDSVDVVNPEAYLATIDDDIKVEFSLIINKGIGYVSSENIRNLILDTFIPIDAYFTPVKKVVYEIENVLVKDDPTFEKIIFDIETDGRINALDAFKSAISTMKNQIRIFSTEFKIADDISDDVEQENSKTKILYQKLETLNFSARCFNCLEKIGLEYIGDLVLMTEEELKNVKNLGKRSYIEIVSKLKEIGFSVGVDLPDNIKETLKKVKQK